MINSVIFNGSAIQPNKVICVGRNYVEHIQELGNEIPSEPVIFIKPNSAISTELLTHPVDAIHYEAEIALLLQEGKVSGVGVGLDLTKRDIQTLLKAKGLPWERAKAFDASAVFSDFIAFTGDLSAIHFELWINGSLKQASGCRRMINQPVSLLNEIASFMSFQEHDIVMTGTPKGVGEVQVGAEFELKLFDGDNLLLKQQWQAQAGSASS